MSWWDVAGRAADVATLAAGGATVYGLSTTWLSRPRVKIRADAIGPDSAMVIIEIRKGTSPVRLLRASWAAIDESGKARHGDGDERSGIPLAQVLYPDTTFMVEVDDMENVVHGDPPRDNEMRLGIEHGQGFIIDLSWQRPLLPWLRTHRYLMWTVQARRSGAVPVRLSHRRGSRLYASMMQAIRDDFAAQPNQ